MPRRILIPLALAACLAFPVAASAKFARGHYNGTLDNGFGTISFTAKKERVTGGRLHYNVPEGQGCPSGAGPFSSDPSFKADLNKKGFFSVTGTNVVGLYSDVLTTKINGRLHADGTATGKVTAQLDVQPGGGVTSPFTCYFTSTYSATNAGVG
jgi:hypothetical protein